MDVHVSLWAKQWTNPLAANVPVLSEFKEFVQSQICRLIKLFFDLHAHVTLFFKEKIVPEVSHCVTHIVAHR
jgi:hypothetical protein